MLSVQALLLASSAMVSLALASPTTSSELPLTRRSTPNGQGMNGGYFYSVWSDGGGSVTYTNGPGGEYSVSWNNAGDVVVGKGFETGANRIISYNADYDPTSGYSFLSVYGWFTAPLVEYYICENWGSGNPSGGSGMELKGSLESDGSTYDVYQHQQVDVPSIDGPNTSFPQLWSIRRDRRSNGTINTGNHYNYWRSIGLPVNTFGYQILASEGVSGSGSSTVTVSEGGGTDTASSALLITQSSSTALLVTTPDSSPSQTIPTVIILPSSVTRPDAAADFSNTVATPDTVTGGNTVATPETPATPTCRNGYRKQRRSLRTRYQPWLWGSVQHGSQRCA